MTEMMDANLSNEEEGSFVRFSSQRKARRNTGMIAGTVYTRLRDAILSADLRPNQRLVEDELADWLNVSRTPIREALLFLEKDGLVERDRGWVVREHNPAEVQNRLESRLAIESYATHLAAERRSESDLREIKDLYEAMQNSRASIPDFKQLNERFHKRITEASHNPILVHLHNQTKLNYWDLSVPLVFTPQAEQTIHRQHRDLMETLLARDGARAENIARAHIQLTIEVVLQALGVQDRLPYQRSE